MLSRIKQTNESLSKYYKLHNTRYYDNDGIGKFEKWADDNGFDSDGIEEEFAMEFMESSLLDMDEEFPPKNLKPKQVIDILRKCWIDPNAYEPVVDTVQNEKIQHNSAVTPIILFDFSENKTQEKIENEYLLKRAQIIIIGYIRTEYNILFPQQITPIIMNFYRHQFRILPFSTRILDPEYNINNPVENIFKQVTIFKNVPMDSQTFSYKLSHNNRRVTNCRQTGNMLVSELGINGGYKKGIHVFRYNLFLENTAQFGNAPRMFWGVQAFGADIEKNIDSSSECSKYIFGWKSTGKHNVKQDKFMSHKNENIKWDCYKLKWEELTLNWKIFDLKLDCDKNTLTYIDISMGDIICEDYSSRSAAKIYIPSEFTNKYGWIPHVCIGQLGQSVVIAEIDPYLFGTQCHQVNHQIMEIISELKKEKKEKKKKKKKKKKRKKRKKKTT